MSIREHRAVQDKVDLAALKSGAVLDDETPPEEMDRRRLSPRQMVALKAFHAGSSLAEAAKAADVSRQTLHRWRTQYSEFSEAMECWEVGEMVVARSRMVDMANNAIDALGNAIEDGDARVSIVVLKSLRILRTYGPVKPPEEKMPSAAVLPALNGRLDGRICGAGFQPALSQSVERPVASAPQRVEKEQAGRLHHNGNGNGKLPENGTPVREAAAATVPVAANTAPPAQHTNVKSSRPPERPKTAIMAGKAGLAIEKACYSALQEVTGSYEMLHGHHG